MIIHPVNVMKTLVLLLLTGTLAAQAPVDLRLAARTAIPTVVHITTRQNTSPIEAVKELFGDRPGEREGGGQGSGLIYDTRGHIVTNYHVIKDADKLSVVTTDQRTYPATVVGSDPKSDLAVLKIEGEDFPFLEHADSDLAEPGEWVLAVGSPLGLTSTVTAGIISAKGRSISLLRDMDAIESFIQTDAAINPGNSGGPLVNTEGKLLGINTAIATQTGRYQGYGFAIPVNLVQRIVGDIIQYGRFRRAMLGVEISNVTRSDLNRINLSERSTEGVIIDAIFPGGSAAVGGLRVNDLVVSLDGRPVATLPEFTELIGRSQVGQEMEFRVLRNGQAQNLLIRMQAAPQ